MPELTPAMIVDERRVVILRISHGLKRRMSWSAWCALFADVVVIECHTVWHLAADDYTVASPKFQRLPENATPVVVFPTIDGDGRITWPPGVLRG